MNPEPKIVSFVLRFVRDEDQDASQDGAANWYSVVRHVQMEEERRFTSWSDIEAFIGSYVDLNLSKDTRDG